MIGNVPVTEFVKSIDATVEYDPEAFRFMKPVVAKPLIAANSVPNPIVPDVVIVPPVNPVPAVIDVTVPGIKPNNAVISAEVAFDKMPAPLDLTSVFPFTPLNVIPVNVGDAPL